MKGTYQLLKFLSAVCCRLSDKNAERMGRALGSLFWHLIPTKRKRLAVENIIRAGLAEDARRAEEISRAAAVRFGPLGVSMFRFPLLNKDNLSNYVTFHGTEKLDELLSAGKGCVLAANHCGNWEMEGAALALRGYPILAVGMKQSNQEFDRFIREYRMIPGQTVEYKTGIRDMLRRLKEGYFVGLLCDQDPGDAGILSDLFGQKTLTPTGPAHFSVMTGLPVMTVFIHQTGESRYEIFIEDPVQPREGLSKKEKIQQITDEINGKLETWIRKYPEEWFWLHNRWKWTDRLYPKLKEKK